METSRNTPRRRIDVVAIAGTGQNGATLCCRMLGELPGCVAVGEIGRLWDKGLVENVECACGRPFRDCPFWSEVGRRAFGGWDALDLDRSLRLYDRLTLKRSHLQHPFALPFILFPKLWPSYGRDLRAYQDLMARVYWAVLEVSGARDHRGLDEDPGPRLHGEPSAPVPNPGRAPGPRQPRRRVFEHARRSNDRDRARASSSGPGAVRRRAA